MVCPATSPMISAYSLSTGSSWVSTITSLICTRRPYCLSVASTSVALITSATGVTPSTSGTMEGAKPL
jgi:hypothetical protein